MFGQVGRVLEVGGTVLAHEGHLQSDDSFFAASFHFLLQSYGVHPQTRKITKTKLKSTREREREREKMKL